jgi:hypothetical protein
MGLQAGSFRLKEQKVNVPKRARKRYRPQRAERRDHHSTPARPRPCGEEQRRRNPSSQVPTSAGRPISIRLEVIDAWSAAPGRTAVQCGSPAEQNKASVRAGGHLGAGAEHRHKREPRPDRLCCPGREKQECRVGVSTIGSTAQAQGGRALK